MHELALGACRFTMMVTGLGTVRYGQALNGRTYSTSTDLVPVLLVPIGYLCCLRKCQAGLLGYQVV